MARQRIHNSRAGKSSNSGASWISYSDMMAALLLVFVLILSISLHQYFTMLETKTAELDSQKLLIVSGLHTDTQPVDSHLPILLQLFKIHQCAELCAMFMYCLYFWLCWGGSWDLSSPTRD